VVEVEEELDDWLREGWTKDAMKVVSGGPGSGKSSALKMFAAKTARDGRVRVLFFPLCLLDTRVDVVGAVEKYVKDTGILPESPFEGRRGPGRRRLLLVFDGLDELAVQGKQGDEVSREFVRQLDVALRTLNYDGEWICALVSGREIVIQSNPSLSQRGKQVVYLLPYGPVRSSVPLVDGEREEDLTVEWVGPSELLDRDQRKKWWKRYRELKGLGVMPIPDELMKGTLGDITPQPLLMYLVTFGLATREDVLQRQEWSRNRIFEDLIRKVYERGWHAEGPADGNKDISEEEFFRLLEEIAVAAWQERRRRASVHTIRHRLEGAGFERLLDVYEKGAEVGVTRLLTAFYFRRSEDRRGERTFEFTHLSFGEYLVARRLVRTLRIIDEGVRLKDKDRDRGLDPGAAWAEWADVSGPSAIGEYQLRFLTEEVALRQLATVKDWQETVGRLLSVAARDACPMERVRHRPSTFREELAQSRNAEEAMLAAGSACADRTRDLTRVKWLSETTALGWLRRLQGESRAGVNPVLHSSLRYLCLDGSDLTGADLYGADLRYASMIGCKLPCAWVMDADLRGAKLRDASMDSANVSHSGLNGAEMMGVLASDANFRSAELANANLTGADLTRATMDSCNLTACQMTGVNLSDASLKGTVLVNADLRRANLCGADLRGANLKGLRLEGARMDSGLRDLLQARGVDVEGVEVVRR
jgi:uncharacterized protein YjbI with pentapeptide repeats